MPLSLFPPPPSSWWLPSGCPNDTSLVRLTAARWQAKQLVLYLVFKLQLCFLLDLWFSDYGQKDGGSTAPHHWSWGCCSAGKGTRWSSGSGTLTSMVDAAKSATRRKIQQAKAIGIYVTVVSGRASVRMRGNVNVKPLAQEYVSDSSTCCIRETWFIARRLVLLAALLAV